MKMFWLTPVFVRYCGLDNLSVFFQRQKIHHTVCWFGGSASSSQDPHDFIWLCICPHCSYMLDYTKQSSVCLCCFSHSKLNHGGTVSAISELSFPLWVFFFCPWKIWLVFLTCSLSGQAKTSLSHSLNTHLSNCWNYPLPIKPGHKSIQDSGAHRNRHLFFTYIWWQDITI